MCIFFYIVSVYLLSLPVALLRFSLLWKHVVFNPPSVGGCHRPSEIPICCLSTRVRQAHRLGFSLLRDTGRMLWGLCVWQSSVAFWASGCYVAVVVTSVPSPPFVLEGRLGDSSGPQLELSCSASVQRCGGAELARPSLALSLVGTPPLVSSWLLSWLPHSGSAANSERGFLLTCPPTALPWGPP